MRFNASADYKYGDMFILTQYRLHYLNFFSKYSGIGCLNLNGPGADAPRRAMNNLIIFK